jgi:group II intron reverse transcriptase/maturase
MAGTVGSGTVSTKQARIAELARIHQDAQTTLAHHMDLDWMREAFARTRKDGAVGIDGVTADAYGADLDANLEALLGRIKSGSYRAPPVRRVHIPKGDGSQTRPIGIPTFEDKVAQRAIAMLLEPIYEGDFYDFSYGFRPGRSAHHALDALMTGVRELGGGWVLDVDVSKFFDTIDHEQMRELLRKRVGDGVVVRMIGKWLNAGVLEGGIVASSERGTPQGGVISPLLANIYLHEVLDTWWAQEVRPRLRGRASLIRFADDFVVVFEDHRDATRVQEVLPRRFGRFGLTLHPTKTRLVPFRRSKDTNTDPPPGSFDFLGFTHYWGRTTWGGSAILRKTAMSRFSRALTAMNKWLRHARHLPVAEQSKTLGRKLKGYFEYYGIRGNSRAINRFHYEVRCLWRKWLRRRSQRTKLDWPAFNRLLARYPLPPARLAHP